MESDWRKFRDMVPRLRERYLADRNTRIATLLTDPEKTETERFWDAAEEIEREARVLRECLDGHSRSKYPLIHKDLRQGVVRRFPYSVMYFIAGDEIIVAAVFHAAWDRKIWKRHV